MSTGSKKKFDEDDNFDFTKYMEMNNNRDVSSEEYSEYSDSDYSEDEFISSSEDESTNNRKNNRRRSRGNRRNKKSNNEYSDEEREDDYDDEKTEEKEDRRRRNRNRGERDSKENKNDHAGGPDEEIDEQEDHKDIEEDISTIKKRNKKKTKRRERKVIKNDDDLCFEDLETYPVIDNTLLSNLPWKDIHICTSGTMNEMENSRKFMTYQKNISSSSSSSSSLGVLSRKKVTDVQDNKCITNIRGIDFERTFKNRNHSGDDSIARLPFGWILDREKIKSCTSISIVRVELQSCMNDFPFPVGVVLKGIYYNPPGSSDEIKYTDVYNQSYYHGDNGLEEDNKFFHVILPHEKFQYSSSGTSHSKRGHSRGPGVVVDMTGLMKSKSMMTAISLTKNQLKREYIHTQGGNYVDIQQGSTLHNYILATSMNENREDHRIALKIRRQMERNKNKLLTRELVDERGHPLRDDNGKIVSGEFITNIDREPVDTLVENVLRWIDKFPLVTGLRFEYHALTKSGTWNNCNDWSPSHRFSHGISMGAAKQIIKDGTNNEYVSQCNNTIHMKMRVVYL